MQNEQSIVSQAGEPVKPTVTVSQIMEQVQRVISAKEMERDAEEYTAETSFELSRLLRAAGVPE